MTMGELTNADGKTLAQLEAELAALNEEFVNLTSGKQTPSNGKPAALRAAEILAQLPHLFADKEVLAKRRKQVEDFEAFCAKAQQNRRDGKVMKAFHARVLALLNEVKDQIEAFSRNTSVEAWHIKPLVDQGIPEAALRQIAAAYKGE